MLLSLVPIILNSLSSSIEIVTIKTSIMAGLVITLVLPSILWFKWKWTQTASPSVTQKTDLLQSAQNIQSNQFWITLCKTFNSYNNNPVNHFQDLHSLKGSPRHSEAQKWTKTNESVVQTEWKQPGFPIQNAESHKNKQGTIDMADMMNGYSWAEYLSSS